MFSKSVTKKTFEAKNGVTTKLTKTRYDFWLSFIKPRVVTHIDYYDGDRHLYSEVLDKDGKPIRPE